MSDTNNRRRPAEDPSPRRAAAPRQSAPRRDGNRRPADQGSRTPRQSRPNPRNLPAPRNVNSGRQPSSAPRVRVDQSRARNSVAVRRPSELTVSKEEMKLIKRQQKIQKFKAKGALEAQIERKRNVGVIRVRHGVDRVMLTLILTLLCLGTIMVFSASYPSALAEYNDSLHYIKRQAIFAIVGIGIMALASAFPYQTYKKFAVPVYGVAVVLLLLVLVIGTSEGEAKRWIYIPGGFSVQPSEIMKTALVLILAWYMEKHRDDVLERVDTKRMLIRGVIIPACFVGFACVLILLEKHLSGTIIVGMIGIVVMLIGGAHAGWTLGGTAIAGSGAVAAFLALNPYALQRITTKLDENANALAEKWQTTQGLLAIGSGGLLGVGLGSSRQKYSYVSAAQNDFIFTIWCEEMGFIGAVILIGLYVLFIWRGFKIAMHAPDTFSALTVFGIVAKVGIQAFLNIAVVCDIIPNTGVSLPFFSYGGSSLLILMAEMGIILSVSKHSYQKR